MKNKFIALYIIAAFTGSLSIQGQNTPDKKQQERYFDINKNIEIFNSVLLRTARRARSPGAASAIRPVRS